MRATIWGCRGTLATPGAGTLRYGGNTSCIEVRTDDGRVVVLDAGTGIRGLGETLGGVRQIDLLLTHLHLDHVEGLGFFAPLHDVACELTIWGPPGTQTGIETWLAPPFFPAPVAAKVEFREVEDESWSIGGLQVTCARVPHPGPTLGYRLDGLAYIPDNEAAEDAGPAIALARGADVLLHDAQYTDDEYRTRAGWGHSSVSDFAHVVAEAAPGRALMFHHDPGHDDAQLEAMCGLLDRQVELAREGQVL
jgi:phosphoribosyl 1,2-cyclic phosphodiesterase